MKSTKQRNRGGNGNCAVCNHEQRGQIEAELVAGAPYRELAKRYGMSIAALSRHRSLHQSEADMAAMHVAKTAEIGAETFLVRLDSLIASGRQVLADAERTHKPSQALLAIREIGRLTELRGKATGELDERPTTVINLQASEEWIQIRTVILEVLAPHPELRQQLAQRLQVLEGGVA